MHLKCRCKVLCANGHINDAVQSLTEVTNTASEAVRANKSIADRLAGQFHCRTSQEFSIISQEFTHRYVLALERIGNKASDVQKYDEAIAAYSASRTMQYCIPHLIASMT